MFLSELFSRTRPSPADFMKSFRNPARWLLALGLLLLGGALAAGAGQGWVSVFAAAFNYADTSGDGKGFAAEIGHIETFTANGLPFPKVSPRSGVYGNALVLSDRDSLGRNRYGILCTQQSSSVLGTEIAFTLTLDGTDANFRCDVTDTTGSDLASFDIDKDGVVDFGLLDTGLRVVRGGTYEVVITVLPDVSGRAYCSIALVNLANGSEQVFTGLTDGPFQAVRGMRMSRGGSGKGDARIDDVQVLAPLK
jgi:hypothetical protein